MLHDKLEHRRLLGIEIGGTKLQLVVGDGDGTIDERAKLKVLSADGAEGIRKQIAATIPDLAAKHRLDGIGVGFGGPVDWKTGAICRSHQVEGWSGFPLATWLKKLTGLPTRVDNDANVGALGEAVRGAGRRHSPVFYITLGSGVGGGLAIQGAIYHGRKPGEIEVGHLRLDRSGPILEDRCSGWALDRRIREEIRKHPRGSLAKLAEQRTGGEARYLLPALQTKDPAAQNIFEEFLDDLVFGLSHVVHLLHPEIIVIGGGLSHLGDVLRSGVQARLPAQIMEVFRPGPQIRLAGLGEDAIPVGALILGGSAPP